MSDIDAYLWLKWLHVLSSTVLFGTGIGTAFQMWLAHRRGVSLLKAHQSSETPSKYSVSGATTIPSWA